MNECTNCSKPLVPCPMVDLHPGKCAGWVHRGLEVHRCASGYWTPDGPIPRADNEYSVNLDRGLRMTSYMTSEEKLALAEWLAEHFQPDTDYDHVVQAWRAGWEAGRSDGYAEGHSDGYEAAGE